EIVLKLLYKEQELRYQSSQGLLYVLKRLAKGEHEFIIGEKDQKIKLTYQTRLVGRDEEIIRIKEAFNRTRQGQGSICFIGGEPGIGKTRLVETIQEFAYEQGYEKGGLFIRGRCLNQENKIPYQPFRDSLNEYITKAEKQEAGQRKADTARIRKNLGELGEIIFRLNPNIKEILGEMPDLVPLEPEKENQRFLIVVADFFCQLADEGQVCILFLDDLQWADEGSFRLLESISQRINRSNLLILGTYRSNEVSEGHSLARLKSEAKSQDYPVEDIRIGTLNHDRLNRMVAGLLGEKEESSCKLTGYISEKTKGNPFFTITLVRELVEQKAIVWEEGTWKENWEKINSIRVPVNIIDMILLKIKDIPDDLDKLLRVASVIGREFSLDLLYHVIQKEKEAIISLVDEAVSLQLLELSIVEKGKIIFVHDRIKEAFFSKMKEDELKQYHLLIGRTLEQGSRGREEEIIFELAHHFIEAGNEEKGRIYAFRAAEKSRENYAILEAVKYYRYVKEILIKKKEQAVQYQNVLEGLGEVLRLSGLYEEALENFNELLLFIRDDLHRAKIHHKIGSTLFGLGKPFEAIAILEKTLGILKARQTPGSLLGLFLAFTLEITKVFIHQLFPGIFINSRYRNNQRKILATRIYTTLGYCYYFTNMLKAGFAGLAGLNLSDKMANTYEYSFIHSIQSPIWVALGFFWMGERYSWDALDTSLRIKNRWSEGFAYLYLNFVYLAANKVEKALEYGLKAIDVLLSIGEKWELAVGFCMSWRAYYIKGDILAGLRLTDRYVQLMIQIKDRRTMAWSLDHYRRAYMFLNGCDDNCLADFYKALATVKSINEAPHTVMVTASIAMAHTERGEYKKAIEKGEEGAQMYIKTPAKGYWAIDIYGYAADAYLASLEMEKHDRKERRRYLKRAGYLAGKARSAGKTFKIYWPIALRTTGKYYWLKGKKRKGLDYFLKDIRFCEKFRYQYELALCCYELGRFLFRDGYNRTYSKEKGREYLIKAAKLFEQIKAEPYLVKTRKILGVQKATEPKSEVSPQERLKLERRMDTVLNTSRYLSSILDLDELLQKIMDKTIELVGAERGILALYPDKDEKKEFKLEIKVVRNVKTQDTDTFQMSRSILDKVTHEMKPIIIDDASTHTEFKTQASIISSGFKSVLCAPIITKGELLGVIYLDNHLVSGLFHEEDLRILELISSQAGVSIQNARLYKKSIAKQRMEHDMAIAGTIQQMFLPDKIEEIRDIEVDAVYSPAEFIGGDYYDIIKLDENRYALIIVDISGHGSSAAIVMSVISFIVHSVADKVKDSAELAAILNKRLSERLKAEKYATGIFLIYDAARNMFEYTNAGHSSLLLYKKKGDRIVEFEKRSIPIGVMDETAYEKEEFTFEPGDIVMLQTDGIFETMNEARTLFGFERVKKLLWNLRDRPAREIDRYILSEVNRFRGNLNQADDITLITLKKRG
ncbi:MAG: SpoIIE family protein phosphatase, partial [bacterium]|nr:SpoIIE family protein phosphatase [bacterium]